MSRPRPTIPLPPLWLLSNLVVLALVAGFLWLDKEQLHWYTSDTSVPQTDAAAPQRDVVVGVVVKCSAGSEGLFTGDICEANTGFKQRAYRVVTVRTASGSAYTVELPYSTFVNVGLLWPPR